ncbi:MAG TPA: type II CAAX endopeptidase family protein, partial [Bryobacteraceae bacterium]|nr:type II CAAX endopeptidase family protein [Bryobacteraceae bacterium]
MNGSHLLIADEAPARPGGNRREQLLEVLAFLFLIVPSMVLSFFALKQGTAGFDLVALATMLRDAALVCLIAYFLWRRGEPMTRVGWTGKSASREVAIGVALFIPLLIATSFIEEALRAAGFSGPSSTPKFLTPSGGLEFAAASVLVIVVAFAEETIFRGYLILRFEALTGSATAAALLSAIIFSVGHGYEGTAGVATVGLIGLAFAAVYLWRRSLVAPIVMHFLQDFIGIVLLPLMAHHH